MFRQERNTSPFSLLDMDMWDTNLASQSSAWYGTATVSGSGFLSKVNESSSGGTGSFRQTDPGLRKWQSFSHLSPNASPRSYSPSPQSELRSGRAHSGLRQTGVMQWLQEAQERMDSHMDLLSADSRLNTGNLLDMKPRERQTADTELHILKQALREAESRAKRQEQECKQTLQKLQTATEAQRTLLNQTTELNQRLAQTLQNHSELKDQLTEANNKISKACLEKAMLSTQVLNLEDNVRELKTQLSSALHDKDYLAQEKANIQEKAHLLEEHLEKNIKSQEDCELHNGLDTAKTDDQETASLKVEVTALRQVNEDLTNELEAMEQTLTKSQALVQELTTDTNNVKSHQIKDLEAERDQLVKDKQELLSKMTASEQEEVNELQEELNRHRESSRSLKFENQRHRDRCVFLDAEVFEKEQQLKLLEEKYKRTDAGRVQHIENLKAVVSHWTEKWQKVALTLQSSQEELEELKKKNNSDTSQNESMLRLELDACKQELELQKHRTQAAPKKDDGETVQTQDKETLTESCLLPPLSPEGHLDSHNSQDKQLVQKDIGYDWDVEDQTDAQVIASLKVQLEDSKRTVTQLQEEKTLILNKLDSVNQLYLAKDERPSAEDRTNTVDLEQQRRMVTEQLKSLFKEREENEVKSEHGSGLAQDWAQMSRGVRSILDRRNWHQGSGLMPVFEEEEPGEEDQDATEKMSAVREKSSNHKNSEAQDPVMLRTKQRIKALAEEVSQTCPEVSDLQKTLFCPDGVFRVEVVDICSPDEDEEEQQDTCLFLKHKSYI